MELGFYRFANKEPNKLAIVGPNEELVSRGELLSKANKLTHALRDLGLKKFDTVAVVLPNSVEYFVVYMACLQAGFYLVPINWHLAGPEIAYILEDSEAKAFIASGKNPDMEKACINAVSEISFDKKGCITIDELEGFRHIDDFTKSMPDENPHDRSAGQVMNYTSGTTGKPKGVKRNLVEGDPDDVLSLFAMIFSFYNIQPEDENVHIVGSPLYHTAVIVHSTASLHYGHSVVVMDKFDAEKMLYLIDKYKVTTSHMVPTQFHRLLQVNDSIKQKYDCTSTRAMIHAAAPCPIHTKQEMIDWWGDSIWEYYAATEGGGTVISAKDWSRFPGTVGQAWPGAEIKIIRDDGTEADIDEQGTVYMRLGDTTKFEYKGDKAKTEKERLVIGDSVFFTVGDIGYMNSEDYLFLCDRKIDMIISGGANIYPAEIESVFLMHPKVQDVAVFGIPNEEWGEEIKAVVELNDEEITEEDIKNDLMEFASKNLAKMKHPRSIDLIDKLPRDENGKLFKRKLRDPYWENQDRQV